MADISDKLYDELESCVEEADNEEEVESCAHSFRIRSGGYAPFYVKGGYKEIDGKSLDIVTREALEKMNREELSEIWEESQEKQNEISAKICSDGSITNRREGKGGTVSMVPDDKDACKKTLGDLHAHFADVGQPTKRDVEIASKNPRKSKCILARNEIRCIKKDKPSDIGYEVIWEERR